MSHTLKVIKELNLSSSMGVCVIKRAALEELMLKLTTKQQKRLALIYNQNVPDRQLDEAIRLCERTLVKNAAESRQPR